MNDDIMTGQDFKTVAAVVLLEATAPAIANAANVNTGKILAETRFTFLCAKYFYHFAIVFAYFLHGFIREATRIVRRSFTNSL